MEKIIYVVLLFILLTILFTFPSVFHLSDKIIGDGGDNYQFLGFQYIAKQQIQEGKFPFGWTNYWRYPVGFDFAISYDSALFLLTGLLFYPLIDNPVIVFNLSVLFLLLINSIISFISYAKITKNYFLGIIGGLIYGFSFYTLAKTGGHVNLIFSGWVPLLFSTLFYIYETRGSLLSVIIFTVTTILIYLSSLQYFLIFISTMVIVFVILFVFYREIVFAILRILKRRIIFLSFYFLITTAIFLFFNWKKILLLYNGTLIYPLGEINSVPMINYFIPNLYLRNLSSLVAFNSSLADIENVIFLGFIEVLFFTFFLLSSYRIRVKLFIFTNVIIFFILSLLYTLYNWLYQYFPFKGIREPGRFYVIIYFFITLGLLLFLKKILRHRLVLSFVVILLIIERVPTSFYLSNVPSAEKEFIEQIKKTNTTAVIDLPISTCVRNGSIYNFYSIYYQRPIVSGYIHWQGDTPIARRFIDKIKELECSCDEKDDIVRKDVLISMNTISEYNQYLSNLLITANIFTVVYHKDFAQRSRCPNTIRIIENLFYNSSELYNKVQIDGKEIYTISN